MTTNAQIMQALYQPLYDEPLNIPIIWPDETAQPPGSGIWIQVQFQPNIGIDNGLAPTDTVVPQGLMTVMVMGRPEPGIMFGLAAVADQVMHLYPKNMPLVDLVRIQRTPQVFEISQQTDRIGFAVSIPYSG